nr:MAG TPA: hypothetical protein [Caudoviricetes sp.]
MWWPRFVVCGGRARRVVRHSVCSGLPLYIGGPAVYH